VLGRGAPTSPGLFRNAAEPIARPTARNRAIAHTRAPSSAVRSCPDHHPLDIHAADIERTAQTTGCELLDVLTDDQHSGPRRKRPQFAITKNRILARNPDATIAWTVSRFPRNRQQAAEDPKLLHSSESTRASVLPQIPFPGASDPPSAEPRTRSLPAPSPTTGKGTQAGRVRESPVSGNAPGYDQAVARTANTANTTAA
jgi:hypothetical protein